MEKLWPYLTTSSAIVLFTFMANWRNSTEPPGVSLSFILIVSFLYLIYFVFTLMVGLLACILTAIINLASGGRLDPAWFSIMSIILSLVPQGYFIIMILMRSDAAAFWPSAFVLVIVLGVICFIGLLGGKAMTTGKRLRVLAPRQLTIRSLMIMMTIVAAICGLGIWKHPLFTAIVIYVCLMGGIIAAQELTLDNRTDEKL